MNPLERFLSFSATLACLAAIPAAADSGGLTRLDSHGQNPACPLKHTHVKASIAGPIATVSVRQEFVNDSPDTIEALYTFPLPTLAAVHGYSMQIGERIVRGKIARREDAEKAYEQARRQGQSAGLLHQERPNVFRQALANIPPGAKVIVEIQYVEQVKYENQTYEFVFPMVVGPRYFPPGRTGEARLNPPVAAKGTRAGHDITLSVHLHSPQPLASLSSETHAVTRRKVAANREEIQLAQAAEIPNQDFILRYRLAARDIAPSFLSHRDKGQGYFSLVIDPPAVRTLEMHITPKELVFVIDTSGSMHGFPLEKAKEAMRLALDGLNPQDTFNLITFAGDTHVLWPKPMPATKENLARAQQFLAGRNSGGATEMMRAIRAALEGTESQEHLRVVCFMTDGYVGNEREILAEIERHPNARVFSFGIGSSVNRFLLDKMAEVGRGEVEYVTLNSDGSAAARRFHERVRNPLLTDVEIDFNGLPVTDLVPARLPDLFSAKPIIVAGRYTTPASGVLRIRGKQGGRPYSRELRVNLPAGDHAQPAVPLIWARHRIDMLDNDPASHREAITQLGLAYGLMTQFTSYYAIEEKTVNEGGRLRVLEVPVDLPAGVSHDGVFGTVEAQQRLARGVIAFAAPAAPGYATAAPMIRVPAQEKLSNADARTKSASTRVKLLLPDASPATLRSLQALGFQADPHQPAGALFLTGRIDASKLAALRQLRGVTRVEEIS